MCGRYVNVASSHDLADEFRVDDVVGEDLPPSWNIAPTDPVRVIVRRRSRRDGEPGETTVQLRTVRWGLVPSWSRTPTGGAKMINARVETVTVKPAFKAAAGRRRALAPALGYYEWQRAEDGRTPYFLRGADGGPLAFASLYEIWRDPALPDDDPAAWLWTNTIITRPAADALGHVHDRCPVVVPADLHGAWLDCADGDPATARRLLDQMPEPRLAPHTVSAAVGNVRNNGPELIAPVQPGAFTEPRLEL